MEKREHWGSKLGFILAASGSAVGLGNIWKFPYIAGENGGGAFTIIYLLCIFVVGMPIVIGEFVIGRKTQLSPVGAFDKIAPKSFWKWVGMLGVASAFVILSFYGVVGGWTLRYTFLSLMGGFSDLVGNSEISGEAFNSFISSPWSPLSWHLVFMGLCIFIIINGIKGGIEKWTKIMMPLILFILILLVIRGITLPNAGAGFSFLFKPKFEDLTASAIVLALGHSFFTLSLGMGTMITYGSYLRKEQNLLNSALWVLALDTFIALLAGLAIFTTVFSVGADPAGGPGLIFVVLPTIFPQLTGGLLWGTLFFFLLFLAALTSAISILEVVTAYFIDQKGWSRLEATILFGSTITIVGILCSLSLGDNLNITAIFGMSFFDFMDNLSSKYMLPIGGMLTAVFILARWKIPKFLEEFHLGMTNTKFSVSTTKLLFLISSIVVGFIILNEIIEVLFGSPLIG
ncbi:MAG: sodium-dependent transporter [Candidatus Marinimicrobia bacterium]|nr:sodium-dependent transporter [Candidatus Neomarinimicrobiota bacterium]|tara:strand:- start:20901 stop:22274 length:1374 start_codon:yes stop_codon:yes gene_type:complete